jgi:hypothetical protein
MFNPFELLNRSHSLSHRILERAHLLHELQDGLQDLFERELRKKPH